MRAPPADWYLAGYFKYKPPEEAGRPTSDASWQRALENTRKMGEMLKASGGSMPLVGSPPAL